MIQRIQSIFLLLTAIVMIVVMFLPIWSKTNETGSELVQLNAIALTYMEDGNLVTKKDTFYIAILCAVSAGLALFSIFQYKNRLRQIQWNTLNSLAMGAILGLTYYYTTKGNALLNPDVQGTFHVGFYIIAAALFFNSLANRFIRKDEKLVRSADRIR